MWAQMALSGGLAMLRRGMAYDNAKDEARDKKAWQGYKNAMTKLADANNQNVLTTNENMAREKSVRALFEIERSEYLTTAQAEVAAAATGTGGNSVNQVLFDIERNAGEARAKNARDLEATYMQIDNQRQASAFQAATQIDYSPIPEPSKAAFLLGLGTDMFNTYQRFQT